MNQKIVNIDRTNDYVIVQSRDCHYEDTLAHFAEDNGAAVPSYIDYIDYCADNALRILNGENITENTENGAEAIAYADSLILKAGELHDAKEARENPPAPEPTEEEQAIQAELDAIALAKQYLDETDYAVIKCLERGLDLETEYPGLKAERQAKRDLINQKEASIATLSAGEV